MMHIHWSLLGIWFGASVGVYLAWILFFTVTRQDWITLGELLIMSTTLWTLGTGIVRSVTPWGLPLCWAVGFPVAYALHFVFIVVWIFFGCVWDKLKAPGRPKE